MKRHRRITGILPRLGRGVGAAAQWVARHPQPLFLLASLVAVGSALWAYAQRSEAFRITRVIVPPRSTLHPPESLIGDNMWRVNLEALAIRLEAQQPSLKQVRVVRELPNVLRIEAIPRTPVAQVRIGGGGQAGSWYVVDREGFVLPDARPAPDPRWIRLSGIDRAKGQLLPGKPNTQESLELALRVLDALQRAPESLRRRMTEINVDDAQQLRFLMDLSSASSLVRVINLASGASTSVPSTDQAAPLVETEVRCGSEAELDAHLARLHATLKTIAGEPMDLRYIDVRFPEPVLGPRT